MMMIEWKELERTRGNNEILRRRCGQHKKNDSNNGFNCNSRETFIDKMNSRIQEHDLCGSLL